MKDIYIIDCGPSLDDISKKYGTAPEWIIKSLQVDRFNYKWIKPYEGDRVNMVDGDAWILTGSPRSIYENLSWMQELKENIINLSNAKIPILGICFGHQLIASSFGGKVELNTKGWELGTYPIKLTPEGKKSQLFFGLDSEILVNESHQDIVTRLPDKAIELAKNNKGNQSFLINENIFGVQFHPEFSWEIMKMYVEIRGSQGVKIDDPSVSESTVGQTIMENFIKLI